LTTEVLLLQSLKLKLSTYAFPSRCHPVGARQALPKDLYQEPDIGSSDARSWLHCMKRGSRVYGINRVGRVKVPRPALAALRMTSGWE
jgi:hypothetical protein